MTLEEAIRRPMVTQSPIAGNLDCRARPFHSELCFDIATFRIQPELRESFRLLQRYRMEHLLTPRDFFYPRVALDFYQSMTTNQVRDPTAIHFTIDGRHGILGARHIADALYIHYEPARPEDFRAWTSPSQSDIVHTLSRGASSRHYILRKQLPPSMFFIDALLYHNIFPLQHWTSMTAYGGADQGAPAGAEQPEEPVEPPADTQPPAPAVAPSEPPPEVPSSIPQATPQPPPVIPPPLAPSPSAEPRVAFPIIEYRGLSHTYQALATSQSILTQQITTLRSQQEQILATQAQHTAILSSRSQQSNALNGTRFGVETKDLQPLQADHSKLKEDFCTAAKSAFCCENLVLLLRKFHSHFAQCAGVLLKLPDICN
uniref:Uncharacterized protein n=1 Tax=Vitis vinifera TaxID=29760 RepID=A5AFB7_VITVI|nr:hypothetical protein VITISV_042803 [Vitis vinifera]